MSKLSWLSHTLWLSVVVALSGCGGGGGGGSNPPPAVSSAATSSVAVTSSIASSSSSIASSSAPATTQLTIQGMAVAEALAGGEVVFTIGTKTYTAVIDNAMKYSIALDVPNQDLDKPFAAIATGSASNTWVQMAASYPSVNKLRELAGTDGVLDAAEYLNVNISAMTTAEYALLRSKKLPVGTDAERKIALLQNAAADQFAYAAFMQKMHTDIDLALPKKYKSTLELFLDYENARGKINIFQSSDDSFYAEVNKIQNDPRQVHVSNKIMSGSFLVSNYDFFYLLDLNEDGTGYLLTSNTPGGQIWPVDTLYRDTSLTWIRKGADIKITLDKVLDYGKTFGAGSAGLKYCSQPSVNNGLPDCSVKMSGMVISLITENEIGKIADISLDVTLVNSVGDVALDLSMEKYKANLLDRSQLYKVKKEELSGYEWFTDQFSYVLNSDGTAIQTNHVTNTQEPVTWQLENGVVTLDGGVLKLFLVHPSGPGFTAVRLLAPHNNPNYIGPTLKPVLLIKRESVSMTASDWVGRWNRIANNSFYSAIDYYSNYGYRDGFETQLLGSWKVVSDRHVSGLSNGSWRMENELLAIHDGKHYMQYCYGGNTENFIPTNCLLEAYVIDKTFTGNTFWESWSYPLFQEAESQKIWQFRGYSELHRQDNWMTLHYEKVSSNMLFNSESGKVLEMLSSSQDTVVLCEYEAFSSCEQGTTYNLRRSLEIKITASGNGTLDGIKNGTVSRMFSRLENYQLFLNPESGYTVTANNIVSSCDGSLDDIFYIIPARDADCEISVTFTPLP